MAGSGLGDRGLLGLPFCGPCVSPQEGLRGRFGHRQVLKALFAQSFSDF